MNQHQQHQMSMSSHDQMMHGGQMMHMGNLKQKFWNSLFLAVPILFMAPAMGLHLPFQFQFAGSDILVVLLATILFIYGGSPFLKGAVAELKARQPEITWPSKGTASPALTTTLAPTATCCRDTSWVRPFCRTCALAGNKDAK